MEGAYAIAIIVIFIGLATKVFGGNNDKQT
jgi:hypothetical protein